MLGNHTQSLLASAERREDEQRKVNPDLQGVLFADDRDVLLDWLRSQPLVHADRELGWLMVHAGLAPKWTTAMAEQHAREIERKLRGKDAGKLLKNMYGDRPASLRLTGFERDRAIINVHPDALLPPRGRIAFEEWARLAPSNRAGNSWYEVPAAPGAT